MRRTYRYRLYPTLEQKAKIHFVLERCRLLYNRLLSERIIAYETDQTSISYYTQKKTLPARKKAIPVLKEVYSQVLQNVVERLEKSYKAFYRRVKQGNTPGFPRYKNENRYRSFTYPQSGFSLTGKRLKLSKIGLVRILLHRKMEGTLKTCSIIHKNGKYYTCFVCEVEMKALPKTKREVGIDLGVAHLAITSDEQFFSAPRYLRKTEQRLKQLQRAVSRKKKGSHRHKKAVLLLAKCHEKIANRRRDTAHKISRCLVNQYDLIGFEDLNTIRMVKNHRLAKSIVDAGWNQLIQYTIYKAESAGKRVVQVNPYQTSQRCSQCDEVVKKTLKERVHDCPNCGYRADRDVNAAKNILQLAQQIAS